MEHEIKEPSSAKTGSFTDGAKKMATSILTGIGNTAINMGIGMLVSSAISAVYSAVDNYIHRNEIAIAAGEDAKDAIITQTNAYNQQRETLTQLGDEYSRLAKGVKITGGTIKNVKLNDEEFQRFLDVSNQIAETAPTLVKSMDSNGNYILGGTTNVGYFNKTIEDYLNLQRDMAHINIKDNLQKQYDGLSAFDKESEKVFESLEMKKNNHQKTQSGFDKLVDILDKRRGNVEINTSEVLGFEQALRDIGVDTDNPNVIQRANSGTRFTSYGFNFSNLTDEQIHKMKTLAAVKEDATNANILLAESEIKAQKLLQKSKWNELMPNIQSYVNSSNVFDNLDTVTAEKMRKGINNMISNIDYSKIASSVNQAGSIDKWIDQTLIAPVVSSSGKVKKAWAGVFDLEEQKADNKITIGDWAKKRNEYLKTIAKSTGEDWKEIATRLGYATKDEDGNITWGIKDEINRAANKIFGEGHKTEQFDSLRGWLNTLTAEDYEIAIEMILDGESTFSSLEKVQDAFNKAKVQAEEISYENSLSLSAMQDQVNEAKTFSSAISASINEATSKGGLSTDTIKVLSSQFSTLKDELQETFPEQEDLSYIDSNLEQLFSSTSDGVKINIDALEKLSKVRADIRDDKFYESIKANKKAIENATNPDDLELLIEARKGILQEYSQWMALRKQQEDFFSDYSSWGRAQNTANEGDRYVSMVSGLKSAKNAYDHGLVGTDDFKTFAALISPTSSDDAVNFAENYNKAKRYLTEDKTGVNNFLADLKAKDLAEYNSEMKRWTFNIDDMDKAARDLGINTEFLVANFGRLRDYGIDNNVISNTEEGISRIQQLTQGLAKETNRLEWLKENDPTNTTAISESEKKVANYRYNIHETLGNIRTVTESTTSEISANYDAAVLGVKAYDEAILELQKNTSISEEKRSAMIAQLQGEQDALAKSVNSTVDALRNEASIDVSTAFDDPAKNETYLSTIDAINTALSNQNTEVTSLIDTLGNYSYDQLSNINFGDGKWDDSIGDAEKAVESLTTALGLTKEQTDIVIEALKSMHKLKGEEEQNSSSSSKPSKPSYPKLEFSTPSNDKLAIVNQRIADAKVALDNLYRKQDAGIEVDSSKIEQAELRLKRLLETKETLSQKTVIEIDAQIESARDKIELLRNSKIQASKGGFNPGHEHIIQHADSEISRLEGQINGLKQLKLSVDPSEAKKAQETLDKINKTRLANKFFRIDSNTRQVMGELATVNTYIRNIPTSKTFTIYTNRINRGEIISTAEQSGAQSGFVSGKRFKGTLLPSHAYGTINNNVGIEKNELALVNELGQESIIRNGVWKMLPGKMHLQSLRKGDIVLNAKQTSDLLHSGKTNSFAKAYHEGTPFNPNLSELTRAIKNDTDAKKIVGKALEEAIKTINNSKDWIEIKLARRSEKTDYYRNKAESDYVSIGASKKYFAKAEKALKAELNDTIKAKDKYTQKANEVAQKVGLSKDLKDKIHSGKLDITQLSEDDKKRVEAYSQWYDKILSCKKGIEELKAEQDKLAESKFEKTLSNYNALAGTHSSMQEYYQALRENRVAKGLSQYPGYGDGKGSVWYQQIGKERDYVLKEKEVKRKGLLQLKKDAANYLKVEGNKKTDVAYLNMISAMTDLRTEIIKLDTTAIKLEQEMKNARIQHLDWKIDNANRKESKHEAILEYKALSDKEKDRITEADYLKGIKIDNEQINKLYAKRAELIKQYKDMKTPNNEEAQKLLQEIADTEESIIKNKAEIEEKKNAIMELRLKPYYDAQKKLADVISEYQTLQKLLGDTESFFNDDGSFTTNGLANITLLQESIDATKTTIANATKQLDVLQQHYANGNLSEEEYKERTEEVMETIRNSSEALAGYKQQMLSMYETQLKMENSLLQKNISKRLEALDAKQKYYEYDKQIRKKSKDINALRAQIAALEGTSNAAAQARLEKLKAELSNAEEDMNDTVYQHEQEMKKTGFQDLQSDAEKALENTLDALKKNTDFQQAVIGNMLSNVKTNYDDVYAHLNTVITEHGLVVTETYKEMMGAVADFNDKAVQFTPPDVGVQNQDTSTVLPESPGTDQKFEDVTNGKPIKTTYQEVEEWFKKLKDFKGPMPEKRSKLAEYIYKKGKIANRYQFQELADILGVKTSGAKDYDNWGKKGYKNQILKRLKEIGFSKGGIVRNLIPVNMASILGKAVVANGDHGLISARAGESVMTEEFTKMLKPSLEVMSKFINLPDSSYSSTTKDINVNNNVNVYVDKITSDIDINNLADTIAKRIGRNTKIDIKKLR